MKHIILIITIFLILTSHACGQFPIRTGGNVVAYFYADSASFYKVVKFRDTISVKYVKFPDGTFLYKDSIRIAYWAKEAEWADKSGDADYASEAGTASAALYAYSWIDVDSANLVKKDRTGQIISGDLQVSKLWTTNIQSGTADESDLTLSNGWGKNVIIGELGLLLQNIYSGDGDETALNLKDGWGHYIDLGEEGINTNANIYAPYFSGNGSGVTALNASEITYGALDTARFNRTTPSFTNVIASVTMRGSNSFTTTALADTVTISGALVSDGYQITLTGSTAATDVVTLEKTSTGFILRRPSAVTSGLSYDWFRFK